MRRLGLHLHRLLGASLIFATSLTLSACGDDEVLEPNDTLDDSLHFNEIAMRCTHNSYHVASASPIHPSHEYTHAPLDVQLEEYGVRAFELDIHYGADFPVYHIRLLDKGTTCETLEACLSTIAGWSEKNPLHHMIVVWVEVKDELDGRLITDYDALDAAIVRGVGAKRLYRPSDFRRGFDTLRNAYNAQGWPTVGETRGRVMVVLLDTNEPHYEGYRANGREGVMFSRARAEDRYEPWAMVAKVDNPASAEALNEFFEAGMLIASNTGSADGTDESNQARLDAGVANGVHMLCDDFPAKVEGRNYWMELADWTPSTCNVVTAGADRCAQANGGTE